MINRKRLLCAVLACSFNFCNKSTFALGDADVSSSPSDFAVIANKSLELENTDVSKAEAPSPNHLPSPSDLTSKTNNNSGETEGSKFNESSSAAESPEVDKPSSDLNETITENNKLSVDEVSDVVNAIFRDLINAFKNAKFDVSSSYLILPIQNGNSAVNAICSLKDLRNLNFIHGLTVNMILSIFMFHLNVAHRMSPEEREKNKDSLSLKISRWLGDGNLPKGQQNSYDFWTKDNVRLFSDIQWNATNQAYYLAPKFLLRFEEHNGYGSSKKLIQLLSRESYVNNDDLKIKNYDTSKSDVEQIHKYVIDQIVQAIKHLVFLVESNYLVFSICGGKWATNLFVSKDSIQKEEVVCGIIMDMILSIFMFHINEVCHMSPEDRENNKDSISIKITRWLCNGNLPKGVENSYSFWKNDYNAKLFSICQDNACKEAYNLMDEYLTDYENKSGRVSEMFSFLYADPAKDITSNDKVSEQVENSQDKKELAKNKNDKSQVISAESYEEVKNGSQSEITLDKLDSNNAANAPAGELLPVDNSLSVDNINVNEEHDDSSKI